MKTWQDVQWQFEGLVFLGSFPESGFPVQTTDPIPHSSPEMDYKSGYFRTEIRLRPDGCLDRLNS